MRSIKRLLRNENIKKWRAKKCPFLDEEDVQTRLNWVQKHKDWTIADWERVIWSDECTVKCSKDLRTVWVFGTPDEKWTKPCIQTYKKGKDVSLVVFGCFYGSKRGIFTPIVMKTVDMFLYKKILEQVIQPIYTEVDQKFDGKGIFMQDNAPYHTGAIPAIYLAVEDWNVMI